MKPSYIYDTLKALGVPVAYRVFHSPQSPPYIIYSIDTQADSTYADNALYKQQLQGTIDLYTVKGLDPLFGQIQDALTQAKIPFYFSSEQYEQDEKVYHYEWVFTFLSD